MFWLSGEGAVFWLPGEGVKRRLGSDFDTCVGEYNIVVLWLPGEGATGSWVVIWTPV